MGGAKKNNLGLKQSWWVRGLYVCLSVCLSVSISVSIYLSLCKYLFWLGKKIRNVVSFKQKRILWDEKQCGVFASRQVLLPPAGAPPPPPPPPPLGGGLMGSGTDWPPALLTSVETNMSGNITTNTIMASV